MTEGNVVPMHEESACLAHGSRPCRWMNKENGSEHLTDQGFTVNKRQNAGNVDSKNNLKISWEKFLNHVFKAKL